MNLKYTLFSFITLVAFTTALKGQDPAFSLFDRSPIVLNPALAGDIPNNFRNRFVAQYRIQWFDVLEDERYEHFSAALDGNIPICGKRGGTKHLGYGIQVISESTPFQSFEPNFRSDKIGIDLAYRFQLADRAYLSAGAEGEWLQQRLATTGLQFPNKYDGIGEFTNVSNQESNLLNNPNANGFSGGAGLTLTLSYLKLNGGVKALPFRLRLGFAVHHITRPNLSLLGQIDDDQAAISHRFTTHLRVGIPLSGNWILDPQKVNAEIIPYAYHTLQGSGVWQLITGTDFKKKVDNISIIFGIGSRLTNPEVSRQSLTSLLLNLGVEWKSGFAAIVADFNRAPFFSDNNDNRATSFEVAFGYFFFEQEGSDCTLLCPFQ